MSLVKLRNHPPREVRGLIEHTKAALSPNQCRLIAALVGPLAALHTPRTVDNDALTVDVNYLGSRYNSRGNLPRPIEPLLSALDTSFPEGCTETSIVRLRAYRPQDVKIGNRTRRGHVDSTRDFRQLLILAGAGRMEYASRFRTEGDRGSISLSAGDVVTLDNREQPTFHQTLPDSMLFFLIYGKINPETTGC